MLYDRMVYKCNQCRDLSRELLFTFVNILPYFVKFEVFLEYFRSLSNKLLTSEDFGYIMLNKKEPDSVYNSLSGLNSACYIFVNNLLFREFIGDFAELFRC